MLTAAAVSKGVAAALVYDAVGDRRPKTTEMDRALLGERRGALGGGQTSDHPSPNMMHAGQHQAGVVGEGRGGVKSD